MRKIIFLFLIVSLAISCRKNFDVNQYAKQPAAIFPSFLLNAGLNQTASNNAKNYLGLTRWMGYWARSGDFPPDEQTETYDIKNSYTDSEWTRLYQNLGTYDFLEKISRELKQPFYIGAAKVMKAYCFSTLVDLYNDIPYKQAFDPATKGQPLYDKGQEIYMDLFSQLDSAFNYFENARAYYKDRPPTVAINDDQYDIMFGSAKSRVAGYNDRLTLWEKFTNTLELKLLMHQSQVAPPQSIENKINSITGSEERKAAGFIGPDESVTVNPGYTQVAGKMNPFWALFFNADGSGTKNHNYYVANAYGENFYLSGNDSRRDLLYTNLNFLFRPRGPFWELIAYQNYNDSVLVYYTDLDSAIVIHHSDTIHRKDVGPIYDGDPVTRPLILTDGLAGVFKRPDQSQFIFSDFESLFLQAEAVYRGYMTGSAQTLHESAIVQNFIYLYSPGSREDAITYARYYISQNLNDIVWPASPNKQLEAILTQKWAAMNGVNWVEAYNDYRRTGFPTSDVLGISHAPTHVRPQIPTRFLYPQSQLTNPNVPPLPDAQYSKVFWDQ